MKAVERAGEEFVDVKVNITIGDIVTKMGKINIDIAIKDNKSNTADNPEQVFPPAALPDGNQKSRNGFRGAFGTTLETVESPNGFRSVVRTTGLGKGNEIAVYAKENETYLMPECGGIFLHAVIEKAIYDGMFDLMPAALKIHVRGNTDAIIRKIDSTEADVTAYEIVDLFTLL